MTAFPGSARIVRCVGISRGGETFPETMATNGTSADLAGGHDARPRDPGNRFPVIV